MGCQLPVHPLPRLRPPDAVAGSAAAPQQNSDDVQDPPRQARVDRPGERVRVRGRACGGGTTRRAVTRCSAWLLGQAAIDSESLCGRNSRYQGAKFIRFGRGDPWFFSPISFQSVASEYTGARRFQHVLTEPMADDQGRAGQPGRDRVDQRSRRRGGVRPAAIQRGDRTSSHANEDNNRARRCRGGDESAGEVPARDEGARGSSPGPTSTGRTMTTTASSAGCGPPRARTAPVDLRRDERARPRPRQRPTRTPRWHFVRDDTAEPAGAGPGHAGAPTLRRPGRQAMTIANDEPRVLLHDWTVIAEHDTGHVLGRCRVCSVEELLDLVPVGGRG